MDLLNLRNAPVRRARDRRTGLSLVETALVLPVFLLLLMGLVDLSFALHDYMVAHNAARTAVRVATLAAGGTCADATQRANSISAANQALTSFKRATSNGNPQVATEPGKTLCEGGLVTVTVNATVPLTHLFPFAELVFTPLSLQVSASSQNENIQL
jgi:Flp pilus assembly protein TadG